MRTFSARAEGTQKNDDTALLKKRLAKCAKSVHPAAIYADKTANWEQLDIAAGTPRRSGAWEFEFQPFLFLIDQLDNFISGALVASEGRLNECL